MQKYLFIYSYINNTFLTTSIMYPKGIFMVNTCYTFSGTEIFRGVALLDFWEKCNRRGITNNFCYLLFYQLLLHKGKMQYVHFKSHAEYFHLPCKFLKKLADDQWSSITKGSIYYIKHMNIQPFSMVVDWPEIWMFNGSIYYALYLHILHFYFVGQNWYKLFHVCVMLLCLRAIQPPHLMM